MTSLSADPGSFRDPGGQVFNDGSRILRAVYRPNSGPYRAFRDCGLMTDLISKKWLVPSSEIDPQSNPAGAGADFLLEHPRLPFVSYPYEWPFSLLKSAALLHLDLLLAALERGFTLMDATAYNIQFLGSEPQFIDHLSFQPYRDGAIWTAHRQFCMQFLNPLVLWTRFGVPPNSWFRGALEGIAPEEIAPFLRWRDRLSWTLLSHVLLQSVAQKKLESGPHPAPGEPRKLPRSSFKAMIEGLRSFVDASKLPKQRTVWGAYDQDNSYSAQEAAAKHNFVATVVERTSPRLLFDLGCNSGDYSLTALNSGAAYVVGFDFDFGALERAVERSKNGKLPFLPLWLDATNPSPSQGWSERERAGFAKRARGDAVIALAFIHHLAIARNIPLQAAVDWIIDIAPVGIIEFPPKSDPMVQQLLSRRDDIFAHYTDETFLAAVSARARVIATERLSENGRIMIAYDRR